MPSVDQIDALLPQTQCTRCGYAGCKPYAEAIASGVAQINQCPPGGEVVLGKLAALLGRPGLALNPAHGLAGPLMAALIDEARCIGCTLCINACPTDAIVGAAKRLHTVLAVACNGCELCLAPCPVDCIQMVPAGVEPSECLTNGQLHETALYARAAGWRARTERRSARIARVAQLREQKLAGKRRELLKKTASSTIAQAIARAKAKRERGEAIEP